RSRPRRPARDGRPIARPDRQVAAQSELALRAGGREMPSATPFIPKPEEAPAPVAPPPPQEAPPPRAASYEPAPRTIESYSNLPVQRPQETYSPPAVYEQPQPPEHAPEAAPQT